MMVEPQLPKHFLSISVHTHSVEIVSPKPQKNRTRSMPTSFWTLVKTYSLTNLPTTTTPPPPPPSNTTVIRDLKLFFLWFFLILTTTIGFKKNSKIDLILCLKSPSYTCYPGSMEDVPPINPPRIEKPYCLPLTLTSSFWAPHFGKNLLLGPPLGRAPVKYILKGAPVCRGRWARSIGDSSPTTYPNPPGPPTPRGR